MNWLQRAMFIGAHFWFVPLGTAFTSPAAGNVSQDGAWPDVDDPIWDDYALGACESYEIDPKYGTGETILVPSPGCVQARDVKIPYAIPEVTITTLETEVLQIQLALNTQALFNTNVTQFNPNGQGGPGVRGIIKTQKYDDQNNLILNYESWAFMQLKSTFKGAPKTLTKPEYMFTLLASDNNTGEISTP